MIPNEKLTALFGQLGITPQAIEHPPVHTVEEALENWERLEGTHTKNLMLKGAKGDLWLVTVPTDRRLDLKALARHVGAKRFSFASAETLDAALGVKQGAVSPLALVNDAEGKVRLVLDAAMMRAGRVTFHPLVNTATLSLTVEEVTAFLGALGRTAELVDFDAIADTEAA